MTGAIEFEVEKLGDTDTGDVIYDVRYAGRSVGALLVTPLNGSALVRGAVTEPTPLVLKRATITYEGDLDEYIKRNIAGIMEQAMNTERRDAEKVVREIKAMIQALEEEPVEEEA